MGPSNTRVGMETTTAGPVGLETTVRPVEQREREYREFREDFSGRDREHREFSYGLRGCEREQRKSRNGLRGNERAGGGS